MAVGGYAAPFVCNSLRPIAKVLYDGGSEDPEVNDNAALIAAAPELLEACKAAYNLLGSIRLTVTAQNDALKVYVNLGNALGKVEGEQ